MEIVVLVIHIFLAAAIIGVILLQPPESSSLGGLGGSNPMAGVATRGQGNFLTRTTAILATGFIITSLILAVMSGHKPKDASILDHAKAPVAEAQSQAEAEAADNAEEAKEDIPATAPSVPLSK